VAEVPPALSGAHALQLGRDLRPLRRDPLVRSAAATIVSLLVAAAVVPGLDLVADVRSVTMLAGSTLNAWRSTFVPAALATLTAWIAGCAMGVAVASGGAHVRVLCLPAMRALASVPLLILVLAGIALSGVHVFALFAAIAAGQCVRYARDAFTVAERELQQLYVEAARGLELRRAYVLRWHVLPNCASRLALLPLAGPLRAAVMVHATVAFLGFVPAADASLGRVLASGTSAAAVGAAAVLCLSLLALHVLAHRMRAFGVGA
jgi:peptide/nickel transport system permease protein